MARSNLAETLTYTSFLGVASIPSPNSATSSTTYDQHARPTSSTSPHGATPLTPTTTRQPAAPPPPPTAAGPRPPWTAWGAPIKVETGYDTTTVSIVDTEYDSCACSPLGKVKRVSQPYAPGGTVYWTTYTYDCLGRTISVAQPRELGHHHLRL